MNTDDVRNLCNVLIKYIFKTPGINGVYRYEYKTFSEIVWYCRNNVFTFLHTPCIRGVA